MRRRLGTVVVAITFAAIVVAPSASGVSGECATVNITQKIDLWTGTKLRGANIYEGDPSTPGGVFGDAAYSQSDFDELSAAGANYVQISHAGIFTETPPYGPNMAAVQNLDNVLAMAKNAHLYAVVAFRSGPGRNENAVGRNAPILEDIWTSQAAHDAWVEMLRYTATRYKDNPNVIGYSVMMEPNAGSRFDYTSPDDFYAHQAGTLNDVNVLFADATRAIRAVDTTTPILLEPEGYAGVDYLPHVTITGDAKTVYTVHDYTPFEYTNAVKRKHKKLKKYPGSYDVNGDGQKELVDRAFLEQYLGTVGSFGTTHHVPVAITEFGVRDFAPNSLTYINDRLSIQEAIGSYASWVWAPAGFHDPFSVHNPGPIQDALKTAWARNCYRPA